MNTNIIILMFASACVFVLLSVFSWQNFPDCFIKDRGLTPFKKTSEYIISLILVGAVFLILNRKKEFDRDVLNLIVASILFTIISELAFTLYTDDYGFFNFVGHLLKIFSFYLIFRAIVITGLSRPYTILFRNLLKKDEMLKNANERLEGVVAKRTEKLLRSYQNLQGEINERRKIEVSLRESEKQYRLLAENIVDVIWTSDLELNWSYISPSITQLTGYTRKEAMNLSIEELLTPDSLHKAIEILEEELSKIAGDNDREIARKLEAQFYCKDGSAIWVEINANLQLDSKGQPIGILGVTRNISDRKQAEEEKEELEKKLYQKQKMEATGRLASGIAHDFNNILEIIFLNTELAMDDAEGNESLQKCLAEIQSVSVRGKGVIKQLFSFARGKQQKTEPIDICPIIHESLELTRAMMPPSVKIQKNIDGEKRMILADPTQIHQVAVNLLKNAAHAMAGENSGVLEVSLSTIRVDEECASRFGKLSQGTYVEFKVSDTGYGVRPEFIDSIFDPYFTTKEFGRGTGLGLSVVHGIVERCSGEIIVSSEPEKGTTFKVYFPILNGESELGDASLSEAMG